MKCPKCGYLGFEDVERCRNCGYDFSLTPAGDAIADLAIRRDTKALTTLDDLSLIDSCAALRRPTEDVAADLDRVLGAPDPPVRPEAPARPRRVNAAKSGAAAPAAASELPLFGPAMSDDEPLITRASPPRAPLAVRRATPDVPKLRSDAPRNPSFDLVLEDTPRGGSISPAERAATGTWTDAAEAVADAGVAARLIAV